MTEKFEKAHPFVKIKVSTELITQLFGENRTPTICLKGLKGDYSCVGIIQNSNTGTFEFLLKGKYCLEGLFAKPFLPEYKRIDVLDKQRVKEVILQHIKGKSYGSSAIVDEELNKILKELGLDKC